MERSRKRDVSPGSVTRLRIGGRDQGGSILDAMSEYRTAAEKFDRYPGDGPFFELLIDYGENQLPNDHPYRAQYFGNLGWRWCKRNSTSWPSRCCYPATRSERNQRARTPTI